MKCYVYAAVAVLAGLAASNADASILSRLAAAGSSNIIFEDDSREFIYDALTVDTDGDGIGDTGDGFLGAGDALVGFAKINQTSPPPGSANNSIYAVFSQTFDPSTFGAVAVAPGLTVYSGTFIPTPSASAASLDSILALNSAAVGGFDPGAMLAFIEAPDPPGFSEDLATTSLAGVGVGGKISSILDVEGTVAFTAGLSAASDFFAFQTAPLIAGVTDYVAGGIALTDSIDTSLTLGTFGAGLSITDNFLPGVIFNRVVASTYFQSVTPTGPKFFGPGPYDVAIVNGNFGGIDENPAGPAEPTGADNVQGGSGAAGELNFLNNADAVLNATVVPEPVSAIIWLGLGGIGLVGLRRRNRLNGTV